MRLHKILRAFAIGSIAALSMAFPAHAQVTASLSAGATCGGANNGAFTTSGPVVKVSLCLTATTQPVCATTYRFLAANAGEAGRFNITARALSANYGFSNAAVLAFPVPINNPATGDLGSGSTFGAPVAPSPAQQLVATFDLTPQANATNASYVFSLDPAISSVDIDQDGTCGGALALLHQAISANFTLNLSSAPAFTSAATTTFTVGTAGSFSVTASGNPAPTFAAVGVLPGGVSLSSAGLLAGSPASGSAGTYPLTITASNGSPPNGTQNFSLVVAKRTQTITFGPIAGQSFNASPFTITGASASSALPLAFTSGTAPVCTVSGAVVTFVSGGTCSITANQAGNVDFLAAASVTQSFTVSASAPAAPTIGSGTPGNNTATVAFTAPANNGGSAILDYTATCTGTPNGSATNTSSPITVSGLINGNSYSCTVVARNAVGTGPASSAVTVVPSPVPVPPAFTSAPATTFTFGVAGSYNVTATGSPPPTFTTTGPLPGGVNLSAGGVLAGTPTAAGTFPFTIVATGTAPAATQAFTLTVNKANQTITFGPIANQPFNASPIALSATSTSALPVTFSSSTPSVCTVSGASAAFVAAGTCNIIADQAGNANFNAAAAVPRSFTVTASAPGAPTIGVAQPANMQAFIGFSPPSVTGGSPILDYTATCTGGTGGAATGTTSPINVTGLVNGTTYTCSVTARNITGSGPASGTATVTPAPIVPPGAPTIGSASPGNTQAIIAFTPPASNGGSAITGYTATCNPGAVSATAAGSPVTVTGLTNNTTYTCSVRAINIAGPGQPSGAVSVTPVNVPITLTSTTNLAAYGSPVTLIASVTGNGQTGTVSFGVATNNGQVALPCGPVTLVAGMASCIAPGAYQNLNPRLYLASYSGDASNAPASTSYSQNVTANSASLSVAAYPLPPIVNGRTTVLTALVKMNSPVGNITFFDNAVPIAGCTQMTLALLPDATDAAVATCTVTAPATASGVKQYVATYFYPAGHISGRVFEQTNYDLRVTAQGPADYTDMWWAGVGENGWGMSVTQHGPIQFNVIFAYDNLGKSLWYVMPGGSFNAAGTVFSGPLYLSKSSPFSAYDKSQFVIGAPVGSATITYTSNNAATLAYTINGISASKSIQREIFAAETSGPNLRVNDLWWATFAEDGWGMNIAQQGRALFPVWYTYNAAGNATFFTAQNGSWNGTVWSGTVYTHTSSAWLGVPYNPSLFTATVVGNMSLDFTDASNATMSYTVNGFTQTKHIERQPY